MTALLNSGATRLRLVPETNEFGDRMFAGTLIFNKIASETFSARTIKLSDYCSVLSGDAYILNTESGTYGTKIEFLCYDVFLGLYGPALSRDYITEIKHVNK